MLAHDNRILVFMQFFVIRIGKIIDVRRGGGSFILRLKVYFTGVFSNKASAAPVE
ncbi:MAG: hypothetical protein R3D66_03615 [Alphaproteobacteria bacterium]